MLSALLWSPAPHSLQPLTSHRRLLGLSRPDHLQYHPGNSLVLGQPVPGAVHSFPAPNHPGSHTHHQDVSTRAGRVSSSSSNRQARPRRADAGDTSGAAGLGAGTRMRARRGASCAASSAPRGLSIAPRRLPPRSPQGRGRAPSGLPQASPSSPLRVAMGTVGDWGPRGTWSPAAGRAQSSQELPSCRARRPTRAEPGCRRLGCGVCGSGARSAAGARERGQPLRPQLSLDGAGRGRGHARPSAGLRPRQPGCSAAP